MLDTRTLMSEMGSPSPAPRRTETHAYVRPLGDLPPRGSRLVATYQLGSHEIITAEGCPLADDELVRLFTSWYDQVGIPDVHNPDADPLLPVGYNESGASFARMADWHVPTRTTEF